MPARTMDSKLKYMIEDKEVSVYNRGPDMTAVGLMPYRGHFGTKAIRVLLLWGILSPNGIKKTRFEGEHLCLQNRCFIFFS